MGYIEINAFGVVLRPSYLVTNHVEQRNFLNMFKYVFSSSVDAQKDMLKKQMKDKETLYTVTVDTKNGERVIAVPKKDYDKIQKGSHIKYNNGKIEIS